MNLKLEKNKWYAWKMIPGYNGELYNSPIKIRNIERIHGSDSLELYFYNACYVDGVKNVTKTLKVLFHTAQSMICEIQPTDEDLKINRMAIIEEIDYHWIKRYITKENIDQNISVSDYLDKYF